MQLMVKRFVVLGALCAAASSSPAAATEGVATTTPTNIANSLYDAAGSSGAHDLTVRLDEALNSLTYSVHQYDSQTWNDDTGRYKVDCSGYANRMLDDAVPTAFDELKAARGTSRPHSEDYYYFFKSIAIGGTRGRWRRPEYVSYLKPGDLLVVRYDTDPGTGSTGHTMMVVGLVTPDTTRGSRIYRVRVTDSAKSGHSHDNRGANGSGVGAGEILVKADPSGQPIAYTWSLSGPWHTDVHLAMGRPRE